MRNLRLDICYDGTRYRGWQRLPGRDDTIQGKLETALSRILDESVEIVGSGRTDSGVHAKGQVANFHCHSMMPCSEILSHLRSYLPEDLGIYSCKEVSPRFHARLNVKSKTYCYRIWNGSTPCVFERKYVSVISDKLDLDRMIETGQSFLGEHDFSAFCANKHLKKSTIRQIHSLNISKHGDEIRITVNGNGFLHHMVRILVGTLIEVGLHKRSVQSVETLFGAKREEAGFLAEAKGLCLMEVTY